MQPNKRPDTDGLTVEFYRCFGDNIDNIVFIVLNWCVQMYILIKGFIALIFKKGGGLN